MTRVLLAATILLFGCDGSELKVQAPDSPPPQPTVQMGVEIVGGKLISMVQPRLPKAAKRLGLTGPVLMSVKIDGAGDVAEVQVVRGHSALNSAAEEAVRRWKYEPMLVQRHPLPFWTTAVVKFRN